MAKLVAHAEFINGVPVWAEFAPDDRAAYGGELFAVANVNGVRHIIPLDIDRYYDTERAYPWRQIVANLITIAAQASEQPDTSS